MSIDNIIKDNYSRQEEKKQEYNILNAIRSAVTKPIIYAAAMLAFGCAPDGSEVILKNPTPTSIVTPTPTVTPTVTPTPTPTPTTDPKEEALEIRLAENDIYLTASKYQDLPYPGEPLVSESRILMDTRNKYGAQSIADLFADYLSAPGVTDSDGNSYPKSIILDRFLRWTNDIKLGPDVEIDHTIINGTRYGIEIHKLTREVSFVCGVDGGSESILTFIFPTDATMEDLWTNVLRPGLGIAWDINGGWFTQEVFEDPL